MGSHLVDELERTGHDVWGVDDLSGGYLRNVRNKKKFIKLDLRDRRKTAAVVEKIMPTIVFHLAADATEGRSHFTPHSAVDRNFVAYMNILVPAIKHGMKKMVLTSSMSVYGAQQPPFHEAMPTLPEDTYAVSKSSMEAVTRIKSKVFGFDYVIIRPHNVFGPRQNIADPYRNVIGIFLNRLLHGKHFFVYGDGEQKRAFSYISDSVPPMVTAAFSDRCNGEIINVGGEEVVTLNEIASIVLEEFFGKKGIPKRYEPKHTDARPQEVKFAFSDHAKARELIGFRPKVSIREGLREMIAWAREIGPQEFQYLSDFDLTHPTMPKTWGKKLL
jgi:UDP-glucose 4-epimerase